MDAITLLKQDHRAVDGLFEQFEALGSRAKKAKAHVVEQIILELSVHAQIEEQIFYPALKRAMDDVAMVCEAVEEHDVLKYVIGQLRSGDVQDEMFTARVTVLKEMVQHHVKEEEKEMFPLARKLLGDQLSALGEQMLALKQQATTSMPKVTITMTSAAPIEAERPSL